MADYDRLPPDLRAWLATAVLPWSPRSAARAFDDALKRQRSDRAAALAELDRLQQRRLARASSQPGGALRGSAWALEAPVRRSLQR
jgi:hypothetical protein